MQFEFFLDNDDLARRNVEFCKYMFTMSINAAFAKLVLLKVTHGDTQDIRTEIIETFRQQHLEAPLQLLGKK